MSLLFVVLKKLFWSGLSLSKRASLSTLKTYRNDFQGHPTILSMNASDYSSNRQLLEQALRQLASGINGNVEIESIIKRTATGRIDSNSISKHIREIYDFKTSFLTAVEDMLQRINSKFSSIQGNQELVLSKLTNMEIKNVWKTKHEFSRELKVIIQAECENEEKQKEANDLLFDFVKIIQSDITIESDKIRRIIAVRMEWYGEPTLQLLDDLIEWFSDIADLANGIGNARLGSIVLPIFCSSVQDILTLLKYMNGDQNKQHLSRITSTVRKLLGFPCSLSWKVEPMSLRNALSSSLLSNGKEKRSQEEKDLVLPINVTNIEQLTDIWNMFGGAERSSNVEKISATLSQIFGKTIRLKTYVDNDQVQSIVYETGYIESQPENSTDGQSSDKKHIKEFQSSDEGFNENPPSQSSDELHKKLMQRKIRLPDKFDGGFIESQPDKSTDDQSSDKEHKIQILRKIMFRFDEDLLSMTDVSEVRGNSKEEEVNWVKSVLALNITADNAMTYLARSIFKQFFKSLNFHEKMNLKNLLYIAQNRHKDYKLRRVKDKRVWVVNSQVCSSLLEKLVSAHWDPAYVEWENIGDVHVESYWKIAKLYMPQGNKDSTCPEDTNMLAIFHLLSNFKVEDFVKERIEIDQMIRHSKDLISHSHDNRIPEKEMTEIFENINKFMESTKLSGCIKLMTKYNLKKVQLISDIGTWYSYKRVLPKQRTGLAVELDRTNEFLNTTKSLLSVFEKENRTEDSIEREHDVDPMMEYRIVF